MQRFTYPINAWLSIRSPAILLFYIVNLISTLVPLIFTKRALHNPTTSNYLAIADAFVLVWLYVAFRISSSPQNICVMKLSHKGDNG